MVIEGVAAHSFPPLLSWQDRLQALIGDSMPFLSLDFYVGFNLKILSRPQGPNMNYEKNLTPFLFGKLQLAALFTWSGMPNQ